MQSRSWHEFASHCTAGAGPPISAAPRRGPDDRFSALQRALDPGAGPHHPCRHGRRADRAPAAPHVVRSVSGPGRELCRPAGSPPRSTRSSPRRRSRVTEGGGDKIDTLEKSWLDRMANPRPGSTRRWCGSGTATSRRPTARSTRRPRWPRNTTCSARTRSATSASCSTTSRSTPRCCSTSTATARRSAHPTRTTHASCRNCSRSARPTSRRPTSPTRRRRSRAGPSARASATSIPRAATAHPCRSSSAPTPST